MSSLTNAKSIKWLIKLKNYPGLQSLLIAFFFNIVKKGKFVEQIYAMQTIYVNHMNVTRSNFARLGEATYHANGKN